MSGLQDGSGLTIAGADPAGREWRRTGGAEAVQSPLLRDLMALWRQRLGPGGELPGRAAFGARELMAFQGIISLLTVDHEPLRLRYRLIGTHVTQTLGRDSTGRMLDEVYPADLIPMILETYTQCIRSRAPVSTTGQLKHVIKDYLPFESVDLPLASDGHHVDMILKGTVIQGGSLA
ncbi:PAS domain-containing protein [Marinibaculum pumilum]|uniref:PAS domain-containing protein n=1 Tax=Marinibaculum pumilum TaxID=1766165 RepID=A0ABV7L1C7_9PROT